MSPGQPVLPATIAAAVEHELVVRKSRFLTHLAPVRSIEQADAVIAGVRKQYWDASHNCVALVVGTHAEQQRSSDDGEPAGTAGLPMLEVLRHRGVTDLVAVVTRYFGGVLLGAGGLMRAYSGAVAEALDAATIVRRALLTEVSLDVPHAEAGRVDNWLREWAATHHCPLGEPVWLEVARFTVWVPPALLADLSQDVAALSAGALVPVAGPSQVVDLPG